MSDKKIRLFWFRRDLRTGDNTALNRALSSGTPVRCLFIFDTEIIEELPANDARITFIYRQLEQIHKRLREYGSGLLVRRGKPLEVLRDLVRNGNTEAIHFNRDYEPYARERDREVKAWMEKNGIAVETDKDQVIFEEDEVTKADGNPYTVFTPYKRRWLERLREHPPRQTPFPENPRFVSGELTLPGMESLGFEASPVEVGPYTLDRAREYEKLRDYPAEDATTRLSTHLRFGTVSIRKLVEDVGQKSETLTGELVWREFFMQILYHFPHVVDRNFNSRYDGIAWRNDEAEFEAWCEGRTGYPLVDAGMRQLNQTGYMHNRVRMVTASFLCKHLLTDWRWGEAYFAKKLLDYELSSNNGNWQWAAGTGCDAAPYFRVFNPESQLKKFDRDLEYVKKWVPEYGSTDYPSPIVDHKIARERALSAYKKGMERR